MKKNGGKHVTCHEQGLTIHDPQMMRFAENRLSPCSGNLDYKCKKGIF